MLVCLQEGLINRLTAALTNTQLAVWCKAAWLVQSGLLSSRGPKALFMSWANLQSSRRPLVLLSALGWITCALNGLKQSQTLPQRPGNCKIWHSWSTFGIKRSGAKWAIVKEIVREIRKSQDHEWFVWAAFYHVFLADYTIYGKGNTAILRPLAGRCEGHIWHVGMCHWDDCSHANSKNNTQVKMSQTELSLVLLKRYPNFLFSCYF